jgi:hypothetical protein
MSAWVAALRLGPVRLRRAGGAPARAPAPQGVGRRATADPRECAGPGVPIAHGAVLVTHRHVTRSRPFAGWERKGDARWNCARIIVRF